MSPPSAYVAIVHSDEDQPRMRSTSAAGIEMLSGRALADVIRERLEQIDKHGFTPDHDLTHAPLELPMAGLTYFEDALAGLAGRPRPMGEVPASWPWRDFFRPKDPRTNMVKACALLLAAIDYLDNASPDYEPGAGRPSQGQPTGETATSPGHLKPACHPDASPEAL